MDNEVQDKKVEKKGSGLQSLILFSVISFAVCAAGIFFLSKHRSKKLAAETTELTSTGYFEENTYVNPSLGWRISFPEGMTLQDHDQLKAWQRLPQIPGFENNQDEKTRLFLVLGDAFSVFGFACLESLEHRPSFHTHEQILVESHERLRQSIAGSSIFQCNCELSDVLIDNRPFKLMEIVFLHEGTEQKRQLIFSGIIDNQLLHISIVYYNAIFGEQLIRSVFDSKFSP